MLDLHVTPLYERNEEVKNKLAVSEGMYVNSLPTRSQPELAPI
jgi:hypothetical protein